MAVKRAMDVNGETETVVRIEPLDRRRRRKFFDVASLHKLTRANT